MLRKSKITITYMWDDENANDPKDWDLYELLDIGPGEAILDVDIVPDQIYNFDEDAYYEDNPD